MSLGYRSDVIADSPTAYWRLGEASGTTAVDASGNGNDGTYSGGFTLGQAGAIAGDPNKAVRLNGSTGKVAIGPLVFAGAFSFEFWSNRDAQRDNLDVPISFGIGDLNFFGNFARMFTVVVGDVVVSSTESTIGAWEHYAVTRDGANAVTLYRNGVSVATGSLVATLTFDTIGAFTTSFFQGVLDEVAFYDHALSADRVASHYRYGVNRSPASSRSSGSGFGMGLGND